MARSIDWSLKKVFIREDLDLSTHSREFFLSRKRQFNNFIRESGIKIEEIPWKTKMAPIEACVTSVTFEKITAAQLQLPREQRQNIDAVLDVIATVAKAKDNVWVYRKAFDAYKQQTDQTFKQFYAEIVKLASMCEFGKGFCEDDKIHAVDQCLLMKLVLYTSDSIAQSKLMEVPDLDLPTAVRILDTYDSLQKTTNALTENDFNAIERIAKQPVTQTSSGYRSTLSNQGRICTRCGYMHDSLRKCPAKEQLCNFCRRVGHFEKMCFKKNRRPTANTLTSKINKAEAQSGAIVSQVGSRTEIVQVHVAIDDDCSGILRFIIDTGSDWTVIGLHHLTLLHLLLIQLKKLTTELKDTVTASGKKMARKVYIYARFYFGQSYVDSKLVVFRDIKTLLISIDVAKKLNIVHIKIKGSQEHPEFESKKYAAGATQNPKSILTPFNDGKVFLNCETRCSSSTIDPECAHTKLLKLQILQEHDDVFESQPPMKGEKFKIVLRDDVIPCCISKAQQIPVSFQQVLKNELDELLAEGITTLVTEVTEWVNPIVVEPKRDQNGEFNGKVRLCVDFRRLNKYCLREHYFIPSVLDVVQSIQANDAHLFSSFDAWKEYHQIELAEETKHLTTFLTPFGRFRYERAPFGINSIVSITTEECLKSYMICQILKKLVMIVLYIFQIV